MSQSGPLSGKGSGGLFNVQKIAMQAGTSPVVADANNQITFNGAVVAAGTHPVQTDGTGPNTMALQVQTAQAIASTDATKIGLASFNSADFTVDANGFVSTTSSGSGIVTIDGNTGSVTGTTVTIATPASTGTLNFSGTGTTLTLNLLDGSADLAVGNGATSTGGASVALSTNASATGTNGIVIGSGSTDLAASSCVVIGANSSTGGSNGITIGNASNSTQSGAICIGAGIGNIGSGAICIGGGTSATGDHGVALGGGANFSSTNSVAIGTGASSTADTSVVIGFGASDTGSTQSVIIGGVANAQSGGRSIVIGYTSGNGLTGGEGSDILLSNAGVSGESHAIRIGTQGTGGGQQHTCYIAGIEGATYSAGSPTPALTYCDTSDGQLVSTQAVASNTATSTFGALAVGTARQNTANYAILVNVSIVVTAATSATITLGVGPTSTPTTNTAVNTFTAAAATTFHLCGFVPAGYYMLVNTTGTITVGSITTQTCAVG